MKKLTAILLGTTISFAHAQEISYVPETHYSAGEINYTNPLGGQYVYGPSDIANARVQHRTITISEIGGQFELFSAQEEQVLANALDQELALRMKQRLGNERKRFMAKMANLDWPKIALQDGQYCFPTLSNDEKNWLSGSTYCIASDVPNSQVVAQEPPKEAAVGEQIDPKYE